jgi:hypothetical protein
LPMTAAETACRLVCRTTAFVTVAMSPLPHSSRCRRQYPFRKILSSQINCGWLEHQLFTVVHVLLEETFTRE